MDLSGRSFGQYKIIRLIGKGGMANVYEGLQSNLDRKVAVKTIPARVNHAADRAFLDRFAVEARTVANLNHPYVVPIYDFGVDGDWAYLVMEYIIGGSVRDHLAQAEKQGLRLSMVWALTFLEQAAQALDFAHQSGVIHRDVKPANMMLRNPQLLLLSDFGVAKLLQDRTVERGQSQVVGTPQYMSPEQCRGDTHIDGRCDIYSLGVVLYQCATGRLPFIGDTPEAVMYKQIHEQAPPPTAVAYDISPAIERIILTAMAKDPRHRYARAADMANDMHAVCMEMERAQNGVGYSRAGPTGPIPATVATIPPPTARAVNSAPAAAPPQGRQGAPGVCFRCGTANPAGQRQCNYCMYDMAAHRIANDRYMSAGGRPLRCRLVFVSGPFIGRAFMLHQDVTSVGRDLGNDLLLPNETVSRKHARLTFISGQWVIEDVESSNGVFVNKKRVRRPLPLAHGDLVKCGDVQWVFELVP